jgi:hypothetical protein
MAFVNSIKNKRIQHIKLTLKPLIYLTCLYYQNSGISIFFFKPTKIFNFSQVLTMAEKCVLCSQRLMLWNQHSVRYPFFPRGKCCSACNHAMVLVTLGFDESTSDEEKFEKVCQTCCQGWACVVCGGRATNLCATCMKTMCDSHNSQTKLYDKPTCEKCKE